MKKMFIISIILICLDQIIKLIVSNNLVLGESITVIDNFFYLTSVRNYGAAFSILLGNRFFLIIVGFLALFIIYNFFIKNSKLNKLEEITYSLLIAGIIGNLIDRVVRGFVIDYLDFKIFNYNFPVFNLADILIVLSVISILILTFKEEVYGKNTSRRK